MSDTPPRPPKPNLPQHLLWEYDLDKFDYDRSWRIAIERVIERGNLEEWRAVKRYYGTAKLVEVATESKKLVKRHRDFAFLFVNSKLIDDAYQL